MANQELRFDIIGRDQASAAFSRAGDAALNMGGKMDKAALVSIALNEALKRQRAAARANADAVLELAAADDSLSEAERKLARGALEADLALRQETEAKKKSGEAALAAAAKNEAFRKSLGKATGAMKDKGGPAWLGPALLAAPVAASVGGVAAGAAIGLGGAAIAGAGALAAFGAVAKPVLSQALTAEQAVQKAQNNYNIAIANGTKQATAYKAEQIAIAKAYRDMSPAQIALSKELGVMADRWQAFKASVTPLIASSLQPWLAGVGTAIGSLRSVITPMGPVVHDLGVAFGTLMNSSTFKGFMSWIGTTGAAVNKSVGGAVLDLITGLTFVLPQFTPLIKGAADGILKWGDAFVRWSASQKAADQIHAFLAWFHTNGPVVGQLLKNVGGALAALAPGLGPASVAELNAISGFFAWIAKLPPGLAKPLVETAAVLLTLNKLGVFSVGVKIVGAAAGWVKKLLGGATVDVGAAGMQRAGDTMVGAAAAMQKAADTLAGGIAVTAEGGKAAAGAAGAAAGGGLWSKILPGVKLVGGTLVAAVIIDTVLKSTSSGPGKNWLDNPFGQGTFKDPKSGKQAGTPTALTSWQTLGHDIMHDWDMTWNNTIARTQRGLHDVAGWFDKGRHEVSHIWDLTWNNTIGRLNRGFTDSDRLLGGWEHNIAHWFDVARHEVSHIWDLIWNNTIGRLNRGIGDAGRLLGGWAHNVAHWFDTVRHDVASIWDSVWNNTVGRVIRGVNDVMRWIGGLPGKISSAFSGAGSWLWNKGHDIIQGLWNGIKSVWSAVSSWFTGLPSKILHALGIHSPPDWAIQAGKDIMSGLHIGLGHGLGPLAGFTAGIGKRLADAAAGALGGGGASGNVPAWILAALSIAGKPASWLGAMETLVSRESGGNPRAYNPASAGISGEHASGIAQTIPSTFAQFAMPGHGDIWNPIDDLIASVRYISAVWGSPFSIPGLMGGGGYQGYAGGTLSAAPGWAWVGEHGPELMRFRGGEQVRPAGSSGGSTYNITVNVPPNANLAEAGRVTVEAIKAHEKRSGKGWRS